MNWKVCQFFLIVFMLRFFVLPRIWSHFVILTLTSQRLEAGHCGISRRGGVDEIDWDLVLMEYLLRWDESSVHNIPCIQTPGGGDQTRDLETNLYQQWPHCSTIRATINLSRRIRRMDWAMHKFSQLWYNHHSVLINPEIVKCNVLIHSMRQWGWKLIIICYWHICKLFLSKINAATHISRWIVDCSEK